MRLGREGLIRPRSDAEQASSDQSDPVPPFHGGVLMNPSAAGKAVAGAATMVTASG